MTTTNEVKEPRVSISGLKFSKAGVKQQIVVGALLRSVGYGSRIVKVLGEWRERKTGQRWFVMIAYANTSWKLDSKDNVYKHWIDPKGLMHHIPHGAMIADKPFLNIGLGWQVVKEVK